MQTGPHFAIGDPRRVADCREQLRSLLTNTVDIMVTQGWETAEVLTAAEGCLKDLWRSSEEDPDPADTESENRGRPIPDASRSG